MIDYSALGAFIAQVKPNFGIRLERDSVHFKNSNGSEFSISVPKLIEFLEQWHKHSGDILIILSERERALPFHWENNAEKAFRDVFKSPIFEEEKFVYIVTTGKSQTKGTVAVLTLMVGFLTGNFQCRDSDPLLLDEKNLKAALSNARQINPSKHEIADTFPLDSFVSICEFCAEYNVLDHPIQTDAKQAIEARIHLQKLTDWCRDNFSTYKGTELEISHSKGAGWFPRVPWVCLCPPGQSVNNGIYVAICFGREGNGAVVGLAQSKTNKKGLTVVSRSPDDIKEIDADGSTPNTKYNKCFANPKNFVIENFQREALMEHMIESLEECLSFLDAQGLLASSDVGSVQQITEARLINFESLLPHLISRFEGSKLAFSR